MRLYVVLPELLKFLMLLCTVLVILTILFSTSMSFHSKASISPTLSPKFNIISKTKASLLLYSFVVLYFDNAASRKMSISLSLNVSCSLVCVFTQLSTGRITSLHGFFCIMPSFTAICIHGRNS